MIDQLSHLVFLIHWMTFQSIAVTDR